MAQLGIRVEDPLTTTAAELRQGLRQFEQSRKAARQAQLGFDRSRERQIAICEQQRREQQAAYHAAIRQPFVSTVPTLPATRSPSPRPRYDQTLIAQQSFLVSRWGRLAYRLP